MAEMEEWSWILDFMPQGRSSGRESEPLAQVVGERYFTLLEVIPKEGVKLPIESKIYVGKEGRVEVDHIKRRVSMLDLTSTARSELFPVLRKIIMEREADFVKFFNKCGPISIRLHQLELLPGVGKRHMEQILEEREGKEFENFADIRKRVTLLSEPVNIIVTRIEKELAGGEKHYLFAKPPALKREY